MSSLILPRPLRVFVGRRWLSGVFRGERCGGGCLSGDDAVPSLTGGGSCDDDIYLINYCVLKKPQSGRAWVKSMMASTEGLHAPHLSWRWSPDALPAGSRPPCYIAPSRQILRWSKKLKNPSSAPPLLPFLHRHHDALHSYGHSQAHILNTPRILGLIGRIYYLIRAQAGNTQSMYRKLIK